MSIAAALVANHVYEDDEVPESLERVSFLQKEVKMSMYSWVELLSFELLKKGHLFLFSDYPIV